MTHPKSPPKSPAKSPAKSPPKSAAKSLTLTPNIPDPDSFYTELLRAHDGLTKPQSDAYNARLILTLANHIGDRDTLTAALAAAKLPPA